MDIQEIKNLSAKIFSSQVEQHDYYFEISQDEQAKILDQLITSYDHASVEGKEIISMACINLLKSYWTYFEPFMEVLLIHFEKQPVQDGIASMTRSGIFCRTLFKAMIEKGIKAETTWKTEIKENIDHGKFKETFIDTDLEKLYAELNDLIKSI